MILAMGNRGRSSLQVPGQPELDSETQSQTIEKTEKKKDESKFASWRWMCLLVLAQYNPKMHCFDTYVLRTDSGEIIKSLVFYNKANMFL